MRINVTQNDIDVARAALEDETVARERCCPVAQSLRRRGVFVDVCTDDVRLGDGRYVGLPQKAIEWIDRSDQGVEVLPFSFALAIE